MVSESTLIAEQHKAFEHALAIYSDKEMIEGGGTILLQPLVVARLWKKSRSIMRSLWRI
ncbi:hypothetical protein Ddye_015162 [Dipteronia dyeriana]|uniref:Uncharacterized protein n=1 Tax=Dipteronia dyeriana TaxID=168575 RepID=A0AAD9WYW3_9ROSI|nr:hypothetical protein Ddye_015162 [Dipteronia dyeriana]